MKLNYLLFFLCLTFTPPALGQSDLIIDSLEAARDLRVYKFTTNPNNFYCPTYGLIHQGLNVTLTTRLVLANMGPGTAHLGIGNVTPGVVWDTCRGYNYYWNFCRFTILNKCLDTIATTRKALYDVASGQRYLSPYNAERWNWIINYGIPDTAYLNHTIDSGMTTDIAPILYAGWRDTYGPAQFGNWLPIDAPTVWNRMQDGEGYYFSIAINPYFLDEGQNRYPNSTGNIPFTWNAADTSIRVGVFFTPAPTAAPAVTLDKRTGQLTWQMVPGACKYRIRTVFCKANGEETHTAGWSAQYTTANSFTDFQAIAAGRTVPGGYTFRFYVAAVIGQQVGPETATEKIKFN